MARKPPDPKTRGRAARPPATLVTEVPPVPTRTLLLLVLAASAPSQLILALDQPCGDGSFRLQTTGCAPQNRLYHLIQTTVAVPTGSGPIFGLSAQNSLSLIQQFLSPVGTHPFHVLPDGAGSYTWQFCLPPLQPPLDIAADIVALEWHPASGFVRQSLVQYILARF
jgi:hypothetical protein